MQNLFDLSGKKAIVTGCRNGIGQSMAFAMARSGADIINFDRNNPVRTREYVESLGRNFFWTQIDLLAATAMQLQEAVDGVAGLAKSLANGLAEKNININLLAPGYIETKLCKSIQDDPERNKSILERIPANRWGTPEDLGGPCVSLASRAADYINGAIISVDGGWMSR